MFRKLITGGSCALAAAMLITTGGCAALKGEKSLTESLPWIGKKDKPKPYPNPAKMAVTWTPDTIFRPGSTPTRGFGGRVFFYDEKSRPVPVEGELAVHGFEEVASGQPPSIKRFAFTAEQFTSHFSQTDLGASYSIWIPWDAVGGREARITLVPSFRAMGGKIVQGAGATVLLPGRSERTPAEPASPADVQGWPPQQLPAGSGLTTTTIPAGDMAQRMAHRPTPRRTVQPTSTATPWAPPAQTPTRTETIRPVSHQAPQPTAAPRSAPPVAGDLPTPAEVLGSFGQ